MSMYATFILKYTSSVQSPPNTNFINGNKRKIATCLLALAKIPIHDALVGPRAKVWFSVCKIHTRRVQPCALSLFLVERCSLLLFSWPLRRRLLLFVAHD